MVVLPVLFLREGNTIKQDPVFEHTIFLPQSAFIYGGYPWQHAMSFETGLYITPNKNIERPDGCKLLLPFPTTPQTWARTGDGLMIALERQ
jgi:hypothetical protein